MRQNETATYDINQLVWKMILGELTDEERQELQRRLAADASLRQQVEQFLEEDGLVGRYQRYRQVDVEKAKAAFLARHGVESIAADDAKVRPLWLRVLSVAAVVAVVFVAAWMWIDKGPQTTTPVVAPEMAQAIGQMEQNGMNGATLTVGGKNVHVANAQMAQTQMSQACEDPFVASDASSAGDSPEVVYEGTLATHHDKEFWMVLDDGTYVHLNYDSKLIYPSRFVEKTRKVTLIGEAYFVVAKDRKDRPFIVRTPNGDVRDYGTEFNVNTKAERGATSVILVKGKVGVTCRGGMEVRLKPGDMAVMGRERMPLVSQVDVTPYISWNTGNFHFDGISLQELMQVIGHWYNMDVEYASDEMRGIRFTGTLEKYEPLHNTLHAIENVIKTPITQGEDNVIRVGE